MIRIISGSYRGRKIKIPTKNNVRPTSDQVRESIFNMLSSIVRWEELTVLDLYAGSGSLGLEALSRGAKKAIFVDISKNNLDIIRQNIELISPEKTRFLLFQNKALNWISKSMIAELKYTVFLDPPFSGNEYDPILEKLSVLPTIKKESIIVVESHQKRKIIYPKNLQLLKNRRYGSVKLDVLRKN